MGRNIRALFSFLPLVKLLHLGFRRPWRDEHQAAAAARNVATPPQKMQETASIPREISSRGNEVKDDFVAASTPRRIHDRPRASTATRTSETRATRASCRQTAIRSGANVDGDVREFVFGHEVAGVARRRARNRRVTSLEIRKYLSLGRRSFRSRATFDTSHPDR